MTLGYEDQAICCEGYGPHGVVVLVVGRDVQAALRSRVRETLLRHGGVGGGLNSVAYLFHALGVLRYLPAGRLAQQALEAGAEAVATLPSGEVEVLADPQELPAVRAALARYGHVARAAATTRRTARRLALEPAQVQQVKALISDLRRLDGVEGVYTNTDLHESLT